MKSYLALILISSLPMHGMESISSSSESETNRPHDHVSIPITQEPITSQEKIAQQIINFLHRSNPSEDKCCDSCCCMSSLVNISKDWVKTKNQKLYSSIKEKGPLSDITYLKLIAAYDRHRYYPASFENLLTLMPTDVLTTYLEQSSLRLIPILAKHGADVVTARQNILDNILDKASHGSDHYSSKRLACLQLESPNVSLREKHNLYCHLHPCCCCLTYFGIITALLAGGITAGVLILS
ncbi:MAG TPA: hypothetical protein PLU71_01185 [Candidatus Dependentiae bacterium]|nr:hypothetical protein [Candidatus Dependentiae bacterium]HRQ62444.1 hypothetical protein [Candidatus Dependentiae bacterium]